MSTVLFSSAFYRLLVHAVLSGFVQFSLITLALRYQTSRSS